jgi:hypothetical protein
MFFRNLSYIIDEKLKNYIKQLNNNYMERYKIRYYKNKYNSLIKDSLKDIDPDTNTNTYTTIVADKDIYNYNKKLNTINKDINNIFNHYLFVLSLSFFTGYHFRSLVDYYNYS